MAKNMANVGAAARRANKAAAAAAEAQAAAGSAGVTLTPNPTYQEPIRPAQQPQEPVVLGINDSLARNLRVGEKIVMSDADRNVRPMDAQETFAALVPPGDRGRAAASIGAFTGSAPAILRNERGETVGVVVRSRLTGKNGINKTLVTLTPGDEYRMVHYTRNGREVSRQQGFDPADMARIYRDTTGIALGFGRI